jgi:transcriptional regulator with XRE-family HTH domain
METNKVGLFIQECRKKQNMTQSDLAKALHVTDQAVSKWERGLNYPDIGLLSDLADLLKVSVSEILKGEISMSEIKTEEAVKEVLEYSDAVIKKEKNYFTKKLMVLRIMIALIISALLNVYFEDPSPLYHNSLIFR